MSTILNELPLTEGEFAKAFESLKRNKACGFDRFNVNIILFVHELIKVSLIKIFSKSLALSIFQENMKKAKVIPLFKYAGEEILT